MLNRRRTLVALLVLLVLGGLVLFVNLDGRMLWQDEAEVALLARSISSHGVPYAWDGRNVVTQQSGTEFDDNFVWRWSGWGTHYLAYLGSRLFGENPVGFRFHGALFGLLTLIMTYFAARRWTQNEAVAVLAVAMLLLATPLAQYARQCRYYSVVSFLGIAALWAYPRIRQNRDLAVFILAVAAMFYFNEMSALVFIGSIGIFWLSQSEDRREWRRMLLAGASVVILVIPQLWQRMQAGGRAACLGRKDKITVRILTGLFDWNYLVIPILILLFLWLFRRRFSQSTRRLLLLLVIMTSVALLAVSPILPANVRYALFSLPLVGMLTASVICELFVKSRLWSILAAGAYVATNIFAVIPVVWLGQFFAEERARFFGELVTGSRGPTEAAIEFLNKNAKEGDVVFSDYDQLPFMLHTNVRLAYVLPEERGRALGLPRYTYDASMAEWVIPRSHRSVDSPFLLALNLLDQFKQRGAQITAYPQGVMESDYISAPYPIIRKYPWKKTKRKEFTIYRVEWPRQNEKRISSE